MMTILMTTILGLVGDSHLVSGSHVVGSAKVSQNSISFTSDVAASAREELTIVDRLKNLRIAVEKLPSSWKANNLKTMLPGTVLTKDVLLREVENMELSAADRWSIVLENTALIDGSSNDARAMKMKRQLVDLPQMQSMVNAKLDEFNLKIKDGILMNLAAKFVDNTN